MAYRYGTLSITSNNMVELNETEIASTELFKRKETRIVIIRTESEEVKCKLEFSLLLFFVCCIFYISARNTASIYQRIQNFKFELL